MSQFASEMSVRESLARYRENRDWYAWRSMLFQMAEQLRASDRAKESLRAYLEMCYVDLNESLDTGDPVDLDDQGTPPRFNPDGELAFGVLAEIRNIRAELQLSSDQLKEMFLAAATELQGSAQFPVTPKSALEQLCLELPL